MKINPIVFQDCTGKDQEMKASELSASIVRRFVSYSENDPYCVFCKNACAEDLRIIFSTKAGPHWKDIKKMF